MNISVDIGGDLRPTQEEQWECELYPMFRPQSPWVLYGEASINFQIGTDDGPVGPRLALHRPC